MIEIRTLGAPDAAAAVDLTSATLLDIPLYEWVLGDVVDQSGYRQWLAGFLLEPLLAAGQVIGGFDGDELVGLIGYQVVGQTLPATPASDADAVTAMATAEPGFGRRFLRLLSGTGMAPPEDGAVDLYIAAVRPDSRRSGIVWDIMDHIEDRCRSEGRRFFVWTGRPELRDGWSARFGLHHYDTVDVDGIHMYGLQSENPPRRRDIS